MSSNPSSFVANRFPVILACFFCVMNAAFLTIPYVIERHPGEARMDAASTNTYPSRNSIYAAPVSRVPVAEFTKSDANDS